MSDAKYPHLSEQHLRALEWIRGAWKPATALATVVICVWTLGYNSRGYAQRFEAGEADNARQDRDIAELRSALAANVESGRETQRAVSQVAAAADKLAAALDSIRANGSDAGRRVSWQVDLHEQRLTRMESQFATMSDALNKIGSDVRVLAEGQAQGGAVTDYPNPPALRPAGRDSLPLKTTAGHLRLFRVDVLPRLEKYLLETALLIDRLRDKVARLEAENAGLRARAEREAGVTA